jgi:hypothetical protein
VEKHTTSQEPWRVLHDALIRLGVDAGAVSIEGDAKLALARAIGELSAGDFLVVLVPAGGSLESGKWEEIVRLTR